MNVFSFARKPTSHRLPVVLNPDRCTRACDRFSQCDACARACPVDAIQPGSRTQLNDERCVACGACIPVCPTGALGGDDAAQQLANCITQLGQVRAVELACARPGAAENGPADATTVIRTGGCLAALGPAVYVWLLASGVQQISVRLDACSECSIGQVQTQIRGTLARVRQLTRSDRLVDLDVRCLDWQARSVVSTDNPPISRRDLLRVFAAEAPKLAARALPFENGSAATGKTPPPERRRLLHALSRFEGATIPPDNGLGLVRLEVRDNCTACGVCARICPTGALTFQAGTSDFRLNWSASACTDCGMCLDVCQQDALRRAGTPTVDELVASEAVSLRAGALRECVRCHAKYAGNSGGRLCPTCHFRKSNPFGSRRPPRLS